MILKKGIKLSIFLFLIFSILTPAHSATPKRIVIRDQVVHHTDLTFRRKPVSCIERRGRLLLGRVKQRKKRTIFKGFLNKLKKLNKKQKKRRKVFIQACEEQRQGEEPNATPTPLITPGATPTFSGTKFYVDPVLGSPDGDGSISAPWRSISEVIAANKIETKDQHGALKNEGAPVKAGDALLLRNGQHGEIALTGYFNDQTIIIAADEKNTPEVSRITLKGGKNWRFEGLSVRPDRGACSVAWAYLISMESHGWHGPVSDIEISGNRIYTVQDSSSWSVDDWNEKYCGGIRLSGDNMSARYNNIKNVATAIVAGGDYLTIEGNVIDKFGRDGIVGGGSNINLLHNLISNNYNINDNHDDCIQFHRGTNPCNCNDVVLEGNVCIRNTDSNQPLSMQGAIQGVGLFDGPYNRWTIVNNVINGDHWHGISGYMMFDSLIANNTVFGGSSFNEPVGPTASWIGLFEGSSNNVVRNNLSNRYNIGEGNTSNHNGTVTTPEEANQYFTDWVNKDFHLQANSPAIDSGSVELTPMKDLEGNVRKGVPDLGAYEFHSE